MIFPLYGHLALPFVKGLRFQGKPPVERAVASAGRLWATSMRQQTVLLRPVHAVLADGSGVWSWEPSDSHAAATRHHDVYHWIEQHPDCDMRLWVASGLLENLGGARAVDNVDEAVVRSGARDALIEKHGAHAANWAVASWKSELAFGVCALTGIDLAELTLCARQRRVRVRSVVPWWHHAFLEAKHCLTMLVKAQSASVCVVEGREIAWIEIAGGQLTCVRLATLESACVASLAETIKEMKDSSSCGSGVCVVLGQGLIDGAQTRALNALVLGRLDGDQPPQWLRPSERAVIH